MNADRFDRNERLFGKAGQARLRATTVTVVGVGGLGTHAVQQLALLGVGGLALIDAEQLDTPNKNRYIGVRHDDLVPGVWKVDLGERLAHAIDPAIRVTKVRDSVVSDEGFAAVRAADYVFGCVDREGVRLILLELCAAAARSYIDLASDVLPGDRPVYGGRVCVAVGGQGCLNCLNLLDVGEAQRDFVWPGRAAGSRGDLRRRSCGSGRSRPFCRFHQRRCGLPRRHRVHGHGHGPAASVPPPDLPRSHGQGYRRDRRPEPGLLLLQGSVGERSGN